MIVLVPPGYAYATRQSNICSSACIGEDRVTEVMPEQGSGVNT